MPDLTTYILNTSRVASGIDQQGNTIYAPPRQAKKTLYLYAVEAYDLDNDCSIVIYLENRLRGENQVALLSKTDTLAGYGCCWSGRIPFERPMCLRAAYTNHVTADNLWLKCLVGSEE